MILRRSPRPTRRPPVSRAAIPGLLVLVALAGLLGSRPAPAADEAVTVTRERITDRKAVFATVESSDTLQARARIGGTLGDLVVDEGDRVAAAEKLAVVGDQKLILQMQAMEARIRSATAELDQAKVDLGRVRTLHRQGAAPRQRLDDAETRVQVLDQTLKAAEKDRAVLARQVAEGAVLAPGAGRVLEVHVTDGAVVMPGEPVATIASDQAVLRMRLPERHARFLAVGDSVEVGPRGLDPTADGTRATGRVVQVYPRLDQGRVIADVAVAGLSDYFVGERALVFVATGSREVMRIPPDYLAYRHGLALVTLDNGTEVVVQPGRATGDRVEILAGLRDGDVIVPPAPSSAHASRAAEGGGQ